jgi:hypothetical protein
LGIENTTSSPDALHDQTQQGKFFGSSSTMLNESTRLSFISAVSYSAFQIPNNPNQTPLGDFGPLNYSSSALNENEHDTYAATIAALQKHGTDGDAQVAVYSRYAKVNFIPDSFGDLVFNDVASNVTRESLMNGTQIECYKRVRRVASGPGHGRHFADAIQRNRSKFYHGLEHRHVRPGRVEIDQQSHIECGTAF